VSQCNDGNDVCKSEDSVAVRVSQVFQTAMKSLCSNRSCVGATVVSKMVTTITRFILYSFVYYNCA